ncbi:hypothetical protein DFS34DRAFT_269403 [Phlyctochytrium arcticum]|nr:hypothetical protein DFS34DRAFT_269403 [Phlyctochytrium arcticum]
MQIFVSWLIARNVTNKLARLANPSLTDPKKATGYTLAILQKSKMADQAIIGSHLNRYPDLEDGLEFLFNAGLQVAHPKHSVTPDGKAVVFSGTVLEDCLKGAFGESHPEYPGMMSALKLLKDLAAELEEELIVSTW